MMQKLMVMTAVVMVLGGPALAGHANPWAIEADTVLSKNHEVNLAKSEGTPGEDEMLGVMVRQARGKLDPDLGVAGSGGAAEGSGRGGGTGGKGRNH
ncbi:MAG: hypothetical protein PHX82_03305 [Paracoccaceae bacterium]|nr:hypothetical protein [Paracoccaceae bacterium]